MSHQFFTAADILLLARLRKTDVLVLGADDIVTSEAEDVAQALGIRLLREKSVQPQVSVAEAQPMVTDLPPLKKVSGFGIQLDPFGSGGAGDAANVRLKDVVTPADRSPMASGFMTLEKGEFPWTLTYDEIDIVLEGELVITRGNDSVRGSAGDVIFIPKGSSITFGTPNRVRFVYVTYPADWNQ
jgi:ethanolamine utilization protein EutQ